MSTVAFVLACGRSSRFQGSYNYPKQFIEFSIDDSGFQLPMYKHVLNEFDCDHKALITLMEYEDHVKIPCDFMWSSKFVGESCGQAHTVLHAISHIRHSSLKFDGYLFVNCDNGFAPGVLDRLVHHCEEWNWPGALTMQVHQDEETRWSFVDGHPRFYNAYEKKAVHLVGQTPRALCGAYFIPSGWLQIFEDTVAKTVHRCRTSAPTCEPQMSEVLSHMNAPLLSVNITRDEFYDWGTVAAFHQFLAKV